MSHSGKIIQGEAGETDNSDLKLLREQHVEYLRKGLKHLSESYECLDASRPWLVYWIVHSLEVLDEPIPEEVCKHITDFLKNCQSEKGGFGGGPGQQAHLAPTYAAVNALAILGTNYPDALSAINRKTLYAFLRSVRNSDGSFGLHEGGEADIRGAYCAASCATMTNIVDKELFEGTAEWIISCQAYEGGFSGVPGMEAHGGYTFCGFAALVLLGHERLCDIKALLRWVANRQMRYEGGFQGRTNKLVDGCYSFWQGGLLPLAHNVLIMQGDSCVSHDHWMFDSVALQEYILICCQHANGGLVDKPGKQRDYYHTCYTLSGLSVAQHFEGGDLHKKKIVGSSKNLVAPVHPVYNVGLEAAAQAHDYFSKLAKPGSESS